MFKDIISNQEGQNLFPGLLTKIKGANGATPITTKGNAPMIGVTADGAFQMLPNMEYGVNSNSVLEIPMAQMGGSQQDMVMKLIMAFAQSRGQDPNEIMTKLKQLPQDQQQQAIQAIAQTMQEEMMQQQQMQQQQMMQQPMAKDGGCIDCQEVYPQAQNLNWFYKAQAGTQVNTLNPKQQAAANQAFARLKHYETRGQGNEPAEKAYQDQLVNFFRDPQYDIVSKVDSLNKVYPKVTTWGNGSYGDEVKWDKIYNPEDPAVKNAVYRRRSISGVNPEYVKKNPLYPGEDTLSVNRPNPYFLNPSYGKAQGGTAFPAANRYPESWAGYNGTAYEDGGMTEAYPQAQMYLPNEKPHETRPNFMVEYGGQTIDDIYQMMKKGGLNVDAKKKKGGELSKESFAKYLMKNGGYLPKHQDVGVTGDEMSYDPFEGATGKVGRMERRWQRRQDKMMEDQAAAAQPKPQSPQRIPRSPFYDQGVTGMEGLNIMTKQAQGKRPGLAKAVGFMNMASALNTLVGDPLKLDTAYIGRNGGVLPKHQITGTTGTSWTPAGAFQGVNQFMPAPMQMETAEDMGWEAYNKANPMASYESYLGANQTSTAAGDPVSFRPGSTADPANPNYQAPAGPESMKPKKRKQRGDIEGSMRVLGAIDAATSAFESAEREKERREREGKTNTTDRAFQTNKKLNFGDYVTNPGQGTNLRPNAMAFAQKQAGYTEQAPLYYQGKFGGSMPELRDGMEIDLSMYDLPTQRQIIDYIYAAGGSVEYI